MTHGSLFSGIGGFDLAAQWMGWENVFHCEWNPFGQRVLKYHFPKSISYEDITKTDFTVHRGRIDLLSGGFPCQPFSSAGLRKGTEDERYLWGEMLIAIREIRPRWVVGENVLGIVNWKEGMVFEQVCSDLEVEGYKVQPYLLPASGKGAPHQRLRVWFVAYSERAGLEHWFASSNLLCSKIKAQKKWSAFTNDPTAIDNAIGWEQFPTQSKVCSGNDGIPRELDGITFSKWRKESIMAYGNAIVPNVAFEIFKTIQAYEATYNR